MSEPRYGEPDKGNSELDAAVAKVLGLDYHIKCGTKCHAYIKGFQHPYCPSEDWSKCGPLIEEYKVDLEYSPDEEWEARVNGQRFWQVGSTPLIAVCKAIVAKDEV